jgi:hypothetical protein
MTIQINTMNSEATLRVGPDGNLIDNLLAPGSAPQTQLIGLLSRGADFLTNLLRKAWKRAGQVRVRQNQRRLRVCETVPLGEKRFIAVIQVDDKQFLVGGALNSVSLLAQLDKPDNLSNILDSRIK